MEIRDRRYESICLEDVVPGLVFEFCNDNDDCYYIMSYDIFVNLEDGRCYEVDSWAEKEVIVLRRATLEIGR